MFRVNLFEKYADKFDIFHNTTARIVVMEDYDDYEGTFTKAEKGIITGDLQPYSAEFAQKDYGKAVDCQYVFYCRGCMLAAIDKLDTAAELDGDMTAGVYLCIDGKDYEVKYVINNSMGMTALLKEETEHD